MHVLVVDGANVVGSRPDGWWRDRAGAAKRLHDRLSAADLPYEIVLVLEGDAKAGQPAGQEGPVRTVHAPRSGDDAIVDEVVARVQTDDVPSASVVTVVTADKELRRRCEAAGARCTTPGWLLGRLP